MGKTTGVAAALLVAAFMGGCSSAEPAQTAPPAAGSDDAHSRAMKIVKTAYPDATDEQAQTLMTNACEFIKLDPTPRGVLSAQAKLVDAGSDPVQVTAVFGAAVAGVCPQYLDAVKGI